MLKEVCNWDWPLRLIYVVLKRAQALRSNSLPLLVCYLCLVLMATGVNSQLPVPYFMSAACSMIGIMNSVLCNRKPKYTLSSTDSLGQGV